MKKPLITCAALLSAATACGATPRIFFTDLTSGPKLGGQNNAGAFVTIYGRNFGATRGTSSVSIGGGPASSYPLWTDTKIAIQLGAAAVTGNIVVTTPAGASNGAPFTVRSGKIYFVGTNGSDKNSGKYNSPWRTLMQARDAMQPGDITYAMNGVAQTTDDGSGWQASLLLRSGGTLAAPMAFVVYPQATATIGSVTGPPSGIRTAPQGASYPNYWVFAGFTLRGHTSAMALWGSTGWRIIANDLSCPNGNDSGACMDTVESSSLAFYGNTVHDTGIATASALYHGVYFGTDSNHLDIGWNTIANVHGCRGIQIHSTPQSGEPASGQNQYDIKIHDNTIHDTQCDGIIVDTIDPSKGPVSIYNNVIYNAGEGPNNPENTGGWSCIYVPASTERGQKGSGGVDIYNNTLYGCGTFTSPPYGNANAGIVYGGGNAAVYLRIRNNIVYQTTTSLHRSGVPYLVIWNPTTHSVCADTANCTWIRGSNNLFYGSGVAPRNANIASSVNANPQFAALSQWIFRLQSNSPARNKGVDTGLQTDLDGGGVEGYDIGALQFAPAGIVLKAAN
jgi:IPT/TIG domain